MTNGNTQALESGKCFDPLEMKVEGTEIEGVKIFAKLEFETCFDNAKRLGKSNKHCLDIEKALDWISNNKLFLTVIYKFNYVDFDSID